MADVTGPISTLPGSASSSPASAACDKHADRPAYRRVQGETDSFGSEMHDLCRECYDAHLVAVARYAAEAACGACDWCKSDATDLRNRRDWEEGSSGPVYRVCGACVKRDNDALNDELSGIDYDYWD